MQELSYDEIRNLVSGAINRKIGSSTTDYGMAAWVRDIFPSHVVYQLYSDNTLYQCTYAIDADTQEVTLGEAKTVIERTEYEEVTLSANALFSAGEADGDFVLYKGCKVFQAGEYPNQGQPALSLTITPEELAQMVSNTTTTLYGDLEHILDRIEPQKQGTLKALEGKLGDMPRLWVDEVDPSIVRADIRVPKWLDEALPAKDVSMAIPLEGPRRFSRYTITQKGRVPDASLVSTMSAAYATFSASPKPALERSEGSKVQSPNKVSTHPTKETKRMSDKNVFSRLAAVFSQAAEEGDSGDEQQPTPPTTPTPTTPTPSSNGGAPALQVSALMSQVAQLQSDARARDAVTEFNKRLTTTMLPAQRALFTALYTGIAEVEAETPRVVTFSDETGTEQKRNLTALFTEFVDALPAHGLLTPPGGDNILAGLPGSVAAFSGSADEAAVIKQAKEVAAEYNAATGRQNGHKE